MRSKHRLQDAIENAYSAFEWHRLGRNNLEVVTYMSDISEEVAQSIVKTPLRQLSNDQLSQYTNSAHDWSDQFLYLLPRYMELIARGERPSRLGTDHIFWRFKHAPENGMTPRETAAFDEWVLALFEKVLCSPIPSAELERALTSERLPWWDGFGHDVCEIVRIVLPTPFDTRRLQTLWNSCEAREANLRLAIVVAFGIGANQFNGHFLKDRAQAGAAHWYDWFTFTNHRDKLTRAFERETDPRAQELLLAAM